MSNELRQKLSAILAAIGMNDGANKGFWRIQPRDDEGQWIEMGADVLFRVRLGSGSLVVGTVRGVYVGPSGKPGRARVLVEGQEANGIPSGVYDVESNNLQQFKALLPGAKGKAKPGERKDKFGRPVKTLADSQLPELKNLLRVEITDEDRRLAKGELTPEEREAEQDGRKNSPIADLPAGFEAENPEEAKKLLRESGIEPDDFDPDAQPAAAPQPELKQATAAWMRNPKNNGKQMFYVKNGKATPVWVDSFGETVFKGYAPIDPDDHNAEPLSSIDDFAESAKNGTINLFQGPIPYVDGKPMGGFEINRLASRQVAEKAEARKAAKAAKPAAETPAIDQSKRPASSEEERPLRYGDRTILDAPKTDGEIVSQDLPELTPEQVTEMIKEAKRLYVGSPVAEPAPEEHDKAAQEAYRAAYVVDAAKGPAKSKNPTGDERVDEAIAKVNSEPKTKKIKALNLERGMTLVVGEQRKQLTISDIDLEAGWVKLLDSEGKQVPAFDAKDPKNAGKGDPLLHPIKTNGEYTILDAKKSLPKPAKPAKPAAQPATPTPATPAKPAKPAAQPTTPTPATPATPAGKGGKKKGKSAPVVTPPPMQAVKRPNRKDKGQMISPSPKSAEELRKKKINNAINEDGTLATIQDDNGKFRTFEDPNSIIDALLEENPNAVVKDDGSVVVERAKFTDNDGKEYIYEVSVQQTWNNQFMERYLFKDAETGEVTHDLYNYDYKDSFYGLYGVASGLTKTRDMLLGRAIPGKKGVDADGVPVGSTELPNYFGPTKNLDQRLKYFRKTSDIHSWKIISMEENVAKWIMGRKRALNLVDGTGQKTGKNYKNQFLNVRRSFVASLYEAVDLRDPELFKERLVQLMGRTPNTPEMVDLITSTLRKGITERYKGTAREKELQTLPLYAKYILTNSQFDLRNRSQVPFMSEDGTTPVVKGDIVRFVSNEGDYAIGEVIKLNAQSGGKGGYKDTAKVRFADGTIVDNLQTRNMLHTEEELTDYTPWVRDEEKIRRRLSQVGLTWEEYLLRRQENPDYDPEERDREYAPLDAGSPYLGASGTEGDAEPEIAEEEEEVEPEAPSNQKKAEDLVAGDAMYNKDGEYIGTVIETVSVPSEDGGEPGIAVRYLTIDGQEEVEVLDSGESRGPK